MKTLFAIFSRWAAGGLLAAGLLLAPALPAHAQARNLYDWTWVSRLGPTALRGQSPSIIPASYDQPESLAADAAGNIFIAGLYSPDILFDNAGTLYQTASGPLGPIRNSYLAKYTTSGVLTWSLNFTSNHEVVVRDVAVDGAGNCYVLGSYYQQLRIGTTVVALASSNASDFLAKISPGGTAIWTITIEPTGQTPARFAMQRLAVDAAGNSAVQGEFDTSLAINGTTFTGAAGKLHALVLRYDNTGAPAGSFAAYTTGSEQGRTFTGIALTSTGETYLSGRIYNTASLQFGTLPVLTAPPSSGSNAYSIGFAVKLDNTTSAAWLLRSSGTLAQQFTKVAVGPLGNCYLLGILLGGSITLGTQTLTVNNPAGAAGYDLVLARVTPNGVVDWLVGGGGSGKATGLAISPQGEATIATAGGISWGNVQLPGATWPSSFLTDIIQLDATGVPQRGWQAGVGLSTTALALDGLNRPVLAGTYGGASPFIFGSQQYTSPYAWNTLLARTGSTLLATRAAAPVAGLAVYPNPARQAVEVHTTSLMPVRIQVLDALGRPVRAQALAASQTRVDLTGLAPGSYTLQVQQGEARSYRHLTVEP